MGTIIALLATSFVLFLASMLWRILNWLWFTPKKLEKLLRKQGFSGNSYRMLFGDMKEFSKMSKEAMSSPIEISDDIVPRVQPFTRQIVNNFGTTTSHILHFVKLLTQCLLVEKIAKIICNFTQIKSGHDFWLRIEDIHSLY